MPNTFDLYAKEFIEEVLGAVVAVLRSASWSYPSSNGHAKPCFFVCSAVIVLREAIEDARDMEPEDLRRTIGELLVRRCFVMLQSTDPDDRKEAAMLEQDFQKFKKKMREEGREEGRSEGRRDLLRRLLTKKFGPLDSETLARLDATDDAMLEACADRILVASRLSEVFGD